MKLHKIPLLFIVACVCVVVALVIAHRSGAGVNPYVKAKQVVWHTFPRSTRQAALWVVACETGGTFSQWATNRYSGTRGYFQVHPGNHGRRIFWRGHGSLVIQAWRLYNGWYNARVALYMSKGGVDWHEWAPVCRPK